MCYIMIAKRIGEASKTIESQIRTVLKQKALSNNDGFFFQNGKDSIRTLEDNKAKKAIEESVIDNLMVHFRMASVGVVSQENVHGWKLGEWTFFHNGGISTYNNFGTQKQEKADSLLFFEDLFEFIKNGKNHKDKFVAQAIKAMLEKSVFWGRAALYNNLTDRMYLFGDFEIYSFSSKYLVLSSAKVNFETSIVHNRHGINVKFPNSILIGNTSIDGVGVISNFSTENWKYRNLIEVMPKKIWPTYEHKDHRVKSNFLNEDNWEKIGGSWHRKVKNETPGLPPIMLPEATPEQQLMLDNIEYNKEKDDLDIEFETYNDYLDSDKFITDIYTDKRLQELYNDPDFIGWDDKGVEMRADRYGIHDKNYVCCFNEKCRDLSDTDGILLKEDVMPPISLEEQAKEQTVLEKMGFRLPV